MVQFTAQELEAMFAVYGDFESVQIVKSFGRVKTMAYIKYSQVCDYPRSFSRRWLIENAMLPWY